MQRKFHRCLFFRAFLRVGGDFSAVVIRCLVRLGWKLLFRHGIRSRWSPVVKGRLGWRFGFKFEEKHVSKSGVAQDWPTFTYLFTTNIFWGHTFSGLLMYQLSSIFRRAKGVNNVVTGSRLVRFDQCVDGPHSVP